MTFKRVKGNNVADGTSYQGLIRTSYTELCQMFGQPDTDSGDGKFQARWVIEIAGGVVATIYDYKEDVSVRNVLVWHIGGKTFDVVQLVSIIFKEQRKLLKNA